MKQRIRILAIISLCMVVLTGCFSDVKENLKGYSLTTSVDEYLKRTGFTGTAMVGKNHDIYYLKAFGYRGYGKNEEISAESPMEIGSITKQMTASAILNLADAKQLNLDDTLDQYFPEYRYGSQITIRNLLNMDSGIQDYLFDERFNEGYPEDLKETVINYILNYDWNSSNLGKYEYSNSNYYLLGVILEMVTGENYEDYMTENYFKKIGMLSTSFGICEDVEPVAYQEGNASFPEEFTRSVGGVISTVYDLLQWEKAFWNGEVISEEHLKEILSAENTYIYGWQVNQLGYFHSGATKSFRAFVFFEKETGMETILLTNNKNMEVDQIGLKLIQIAREYTK